MPLSGFWEERVASQAMELNHDTEDGDNDSTMHDLEVFQANFVGRRTEGPTTVRPRQQDADIWRLKTPTLILNDIMWGCSVSTRLLNDRNDGTNPYKQTSSRMTSGKLASIGVDFLQSRCATPNPVNEERISTPLHFLAMSSRMCTDDRFSPVRFASLGSEHARLSPSAPTPSERTTQVEGRKAAAAAARDPEERNETDLVAAAEAARVMSSVASEQGIVDADQVPAPIISQCDADHPSRSVKVSHSDLERCRRDHLKRGFDRLRASLPDLLNCDKAAKVTVLRSATCHIRDLEATYRSLQDFKLTLKAENTALVNRITSLSE